MSNENIEAIEVSIDQALAAIELKEAMIQLQSDDNFKKVFLEHYGKDLAISYVNQMANPENMNDEDQEYIQMLLRSISQFKAFIQTTIGRGIEAERSKKDHELELSRQYEEAEGEV